MVISTHLIADVEKVLDEAIFLKEGRLVRHSSVDDIREKEGKSVDRLFREIFAVQGPQMGRNPFFEPAVKPGLHDQEEEKTEKTVHEDQKEES